jgi:hypothetical protein
LKNSFNNYAAAVTFLDSEPRFSRLTIFISDKAGLISEAIRSTHVTYRARQDTCPYPDYVRGKTYSDKSRAADSTIDKGCYNDWAATYKLKRGASSKNKMFNVDMNVNNLGSSFFRYVEHLNDFVGEMSDNNNINYNKCEEFDILCYSERLQNYLSEVFKSLNKTTESYNKLLLSSNVINDTIKNQNYRIEKLESNNSVYISKNIALEEENKNLKLELNNITGNVQSIISKLDGNPLVFNKDIKLILTRSIK